MFRGDVISQATRFLQVFGGSRFKYHSVTCIRAISVLAKTLEDQLRRYIATTDMDNSLFDDLFVIFEKIVHLKCRCNRYIAINRQYN